MNVGAVEMLAQEERVGTQVARRSRVVEHGVKHLGTRYLVLVEKSLGQFLRSKPLECVTQEHASQRGTTAFVTQNESQRRHILDNILAVIQARVATRAQDAGQSRLAHQQAAGCAQQVAHHRHRRLELRHQRRLDNLVLLGTGAARAIEIDVTPATLEEFRRQLQADAVADLATRHEKRVQTRRVGMLHLLAILDQRPLGAGRAALCNQGNTLSFNHSKFG